MRLTSPLSNTESAPSTVKNVQPRIHLCFYLALLCQQLQIKPQAFAAASTSHTPEGSLDVLIIVRLRDNLNNIKAPIKREQVLIKVGTHEGTSPWDWSLRLVPGTNSLRVHYPF